MWDKILTLAFMGSFLSAAVRMAIPLAYAALGEMISQKSGTINIGLEANMLGGAFLGFAVTYWTEQVSNNILVEKGVSDQRYLAQQRNRQSRQRRDLRIVSCGSVDNHLKHVAGQTKRKEV